MLIDDYFIHQLNFEKKYGKKTIVLMQVGTFFEFYGVNNEKEKIGDAQIVAELLNIQLSRRNKSILENSRSNALMAGFPLNSLKRFINILLTNNYTVVLIEQVTEPPNPKREITNIYSPGTYIEEINKSDPNNIVSMYISEDSCYKTGKILFSFGLSSIDLSTGYNVVYENNIIHYEKLAFLEEIYRFVESYNPKEVIINYNAENLKKLKLNDIRKINNMDRIYHYNDCLEKKFFDINYQNSFLEKIFKNNGFLSPIEYINLEKKQYALISYLILLQFSYEHNEHIIDKIKIPQNWEYNDHLILYNNAIYQLNIVSLNQNDSKINSLYDVIQKTSTSMGKRLLKHRIMNPITNIDELNKRYNHISLFLNFDNLDIVEKILNEIIDIERLHRKLLLQTLHPYEFLNLSYTYDNIKKLLILIEKNFNLALFGFDNNIIEKFNNFIDKYNNIFDLLELGKYGLINIGGSFFKKGFFSEIDTIQEDIDNIYKYFNTECKILSNLIEKDSDYVKLENNEKDGYFFYTTKKRSEVMYNSFNNEQQNKYEIKKYNGTNVKIISEELTNESNKLLDLKELIKIKTKEAYFKVLSNFENEFIETLDEITKFIAIIDFIKCGAKCAKIYKYNKPLIVDENNGKSFFKATQIRHPIIEIINEEFDYVRNDIELFHEKCNGILLYGANGSGKSSLSKAVGCNIILAQMGFFVPSSEFNYYPYKKIFTRINGDDNIFKGMSSFGVEMDELRSILKYSDERSIVLGDEICKGTEELSALSIVSSSIMRFCSNNVNFIMATHFHKLYELEQIKKILNIKYMHLTIEYDKENGNIIYGRKLESGPGSNLYGVEIACHIIEDDDFIENAKNIRNAILNKSNELLNNKTSNYNNKLFIDKCHICGNCTSELDTHHIKEQYNFDEDDINKNKLSNLVVLCKKHHDEVHNGNLEINGYIDTINGKKLDYSIDKNNINRTNGKKKYDDEKINIIKSLANELKDQKQFMKIILMELKKRDIIISAKTVNKICNNEY
jgi:DNA mismatch repair protein MutS